MVTIGVINDLDINSNLNHLAKKREVVGGVGEKVEVGVNLSEIAVMEQNRDRARDYEIIRTLLQSPREIRIESQKEREHREGKRETLLRIQIPPQREMRKEESQKGKSLNRILDLNGGRDLNRGLIRIQVHHEDGRGQAKETGEAIILGLVAVGLQRDYYDGGKGIFLSKRAVKKGETPIHWFVFTVVNSVTLIGFYGYSAMLLQKKSMDKWDKFHADDREHVPMVHTNFHDLVKEKIITNDVKIKVNVFPIAN